MDEEKSLEEILEEKIKWGHQIIESLKDVEKVEGVDKLVRKIQQEIKFLNKVQITGNVKKEHLQSTNLVHLDAIVKRLLISKEPIGVLKPFKYDNLKLEVDIVCDSGSSWVKVIARNPKALTLISCGNAEYGQKSIVDQAASYRNCAKSHPYMYKAPKVIFYFAYGVEKLLAQKLKILQDIEVEGFILETDSFEDSESDLEESSESISAGNLSNCSEVNTLNLDVSTLLAYVTNIANGSAHYVFAEPLLTEQAKWERERPIKPVLDNLFNNKKLVVCHTAYTNFKNIVDLIGGPNEKKRAEELLKKVQIVEDFLEGRIMDLKIGGKVKPRSRIIFATGEHLQSVTVSANEGFVRAAKMQEIDCMVFIHEPRSLSEMKQQNAEMIE